MEIDGEGQTKSRDMQKAVYLYLKYQICLIGIWTTTNKSNLCCVVLPYLVKYTVKRVYKQLGINTI